MTNPKPDTDVINDYLRNPRNGARRLTIHQDGRSREVSTTTQEGETFKGSDSINDAIFRITTGTEPRSRRDDAKGGGTV